MTTQEFSNEFDVLYNNIMSNAAPGLDEYEKSVFLTNAQDEIVIDLYNGKNPLGESFESTEEIRRYLSELNKTHTTITKEEGNTGVSEYSIFFKLPDDLWFITYESVDFEDDELKCSNNRTGIPVVPITQDVYHRTKGNPFRRYSEKRVIRLDSIGNLVELVSRYNISKYLVKYLSKPTPIILSDLDNGLSINGISEKTECKLNSSLHRAILERAVDLARVTYKS